jgi:hypothetical protein
VGTHAGIVGTNAVVTFQECSVFASDDLCNRAAMKLSQEVIEHGGQAPDFVCVETGLK